MTEVWEERPDSAKPIYIVGAKPIDSIDVNKLIFDVFRIELDEYPQNLKIYSRVYDSLGHFVTNMADPYREDSSITYFKTVTEYLGKVYNRRRVPIDSFKVREYGKGDSIPYNIALTVDYSGSMRGVMEVIFEGTEIFVSLKDDYDRIALSSFTEVFQLKVPFEYDKEKILSLYRTTQNEGVGIFSAVFDAVWECLNLYEGTSEDVPRVLVVFSDGDDNISEHEVAAIIDKANEGKIHIFTVAFGYTRDENLRNLAKFTGGKFYKAYTKEELISIFRDIYMSLKYYYYITYKPPKYWGYHQVFATIDVPGRTDSLIAEGEYNTAGLLDEEVSFTRPILFDFDKDSLKAESEYIIDELVDALMSDPKLRLEIQGHTDNVGTIEYNQDLSERRANAVRNAIIAKGIDPRRLRARGFGMSRPVATNETEDGRAKNRRTQFLVLSRTKK